MSSLELSVGAIPAHQANSSDAGQPKNRLVSIFVDACSALKSSALLLMIVWLAAKDWLFSNTSPYPYGLSLGVSLAVSLSALASFTWARASAQYNAGNITLDFRFVVPTGPRIRVRSC